MIRQGLHLRLVRLYIDADESGHHLLEITAVDNLVEQLSGELPLAIGVGERRDVGVIADAQPLRQRIGNKLRATLLLVVERGVHELSLFHAVKIVEEHLLHRGHGQFAFKPRQRHVAQVTAPDLLIIRLEVQVIQRIAKPASQEVLEVVGFRLGIPHDGQTIGNKSLLGICIKHIHVILNRVRDERLTHANDGVSVGLDEIRLLIEVPPEPFVYILTLGIEHMSAAGVEQASADALTANQSAGFGGAFENRDVVSILEDTRGS